MAFTAETIASGLQKPRRSGSGWTACCPAHDDSDPSLSIKDGDHGAVLVHCFAGCDQQSVIEKLRAMGLWPAATGEQKAAARARHDQKKVDHASLLVELADQARKDGTYGAWTPDDLRTEADARALLATVPRLEILPVSEFLKRDFAPREALLAPWLQTQGLAMIYAPRGVGKTFFGLGVAHAVATGGEFLRWKAPTARPVLYLDGEMPAPTMQERLQAISTDCATLDRLLILTPDVQTHAMPDLSRRDSQDLLDAYLGESRLIVVDNLSTLCRTAKENEADGWLYVQEWALRMRAQGRSVLFIHHAGKGGQQRGTSRREDVLDTVISLRRPSAYEASQGAVFEIHFEKSRGIYGADVAPFEARLSTDESGRQTWLTSSIEDSNLLKVARMLNDGYSQAEIAEELQLSKGYVSKTAKRARDEGKVS